MVLDLGVNLAGYNNRLIGLCHLFRMVIESPMNDRTALVRVFLLLLKILSDSVKAFFIRRRARMVSCSRSLCAGIQFGLARQEGSQGGCDHIEEGTSR
ncbi:hypothetical protein FBZ99_10869 [Rhizobium sp. ERR 1071]|nr:hypothetical protein FBZ99_10869 [Rhizobium sp. ERR1071]